MLNHALHFGEVYMSANNGSYTYMPFCTAERYLGILVYNHALQDDLILHLPQLTKMLSCKSSPIVNQLKFDFDLIEIRNGKSLKLSSRCFVKTPLQPSDLGKISPRSFADYEIDMNLDGGVFETSIKNSSPTLFERVNFLNKLYQCLLYGQFPHKIPKLVICGECDSGKTSWAKLFFGLLRPSKIASVTREKTFGLAQIENDTELIFIDEWSEDTLTVNHVKTVFQGGSFLKAVKNQSPVSIVNNAGMLIICNDEPDFKKEQANVNCRISVFKTKTMKVKDGHAPKWIKDNAMRCLVWLLNEINGNADLLPIEERFYEKRSNEPAVFNLPTDEVAEEMVKLMALTATDVKEVTIDKNTSIDNIQEPYDDQSAPDIQSDLSCGDSTDDDSLHIDADENNESEVDVFDKPRYAYCRSDINSKGYFKEVRRIICNEMDAFGGRVSGLHYLSFTNKYTKRRPIGSSIVPDPKIDAWLCVAGRRRDLFNVDKFVKMYPSVKQKICEIRTLCNISPPSNSSSCDIPLEHRATPDPPRKRLHPIENDDYLLPPLNDNDIAAFK